MKSLTSLVLSGMLLALSIASVHAKEIDVSKVIKDLNLSPGARVYLRDEEGYVQRTKRWQYWKAPDFAAVVEVATPEDVSETVRTKQDLAFQMAFVVQDSLGLHIQNTTASLQYFYSPLTHHRSNSQMPTMFPSPLSPAGTEVSQTSRVSKMPFPSTCAN